MKEGAKKETAGITMTGLKKSDLRDRSTGRFDVSNQYGGWISKKASKNNQAISASNGFPQ